MGRIQSAAPSSFDGQVADWPHAEDRSPCRAEGLPQAAFHTRACRATAAALMLVVPAGIEPATFRA